MKKGFTLLEMMVVVGIIAILLAASVAGFSNMTKTADKAKAQELVSNVATALTALFQKEGNWPKRLASCGETGAALDENRALPLARGSYLSLSTDNDDDPKHCTKLRGGDRFGVLDPWGTDIVKRKGDSASLSDIKKGEELDRYIHYAVDVDGDGVIKGVDVGGVAVDVRATAIAWCGGKDGVIQPYPYAGGNANNRKANNSKGGSANDDVYSWTPAQAADVQ